VFIKNMTELAMGDPGVVFIISLASTGDAYAKETGELLSVIGRAGRVIQPAADTEIAQILKRRLFAAIDPAAAEDAGEAYRGLYEQIAGTVALSGGAENPAQYGEAVAGSYPFHPEVIRVLDKRLGSIPNFQRARSALRLLAEVIAGLWESGTDADVINVADIDLSRSDTLNQITVAIDRGAFSGVAKVDLAGPDSHCRSVDTTRFPGKPPCVAALI
jgi:hypothetical protein